MSGEENTPAPAASTPQCQFFVQRKKRLCRMTVKPGRQYCGEHEPQPKTQAGQTDKRIPCLNDPKHTCYASKLLKHLAICNARQTEQPPYIIHNINAPEAVETCPRRPLSAIPKDQLASLIEKVNHLYAKHVEGHIADEPPQPIHRTVLAEFESPQRAESSRRHLRQVSALLWSAERARLVEESTCYVELGAGKGQLSYYACHAWCGGRSRVLAVDRAPLRHKRDNKLRSAPPAKLDIPELDSNGIKDGIAQKTSEENHFTDEHLTDDNERDINSKEDSNKSDRQNTNSNNIAHDVSELKRTSDESNDKNTDTALNNTKRIDDYASSVKKQKTSEDTLKGLHDSNNGDDIENTDNTVKSFDESGNIDQDTDSVRGIHEVTGEESEVAVRIRADLAHLALEAVPVVTECAAVVGLAKHLCGVATDYALRCVAAPGVEAKTRGAVLATCCHHRIEPATYVGYSQLKELGITPEELNIMLGIVSWATCGDGLSRTRRREAARPAEARGPGLEAREAARPAEARGPGLEAREAVGRRAKGLLDWGRALWLRARGFDARLAYYVPKDVSLENTVIIATKR